MEEQIMRFAILTCAVLAMGGLDQVGAGTTYWDWESGTLEDWFAETTGTILTVEEPGHDSYYCMGVSGPEYARIRFDGPTIEPILLTGQTGSFLPMLEGADLYLEMDVPIPHGHGVYLDIYLYGEDHSSRWISYPYDGYGFSEELGDGWYRHHFANHHVMEYDPEWNPPPEFPYMTMHWADFYPDGDGIDNFTIIPGECLGDLDGDRDIDLADLAQLLAHYGTTSGAVYEDGDLDGDEDVDLADLAALLAVYGTTCD
jgi:hypothetical protein